MPNRTDLAAGQVTNHDRIVIELIQPPHSPAFIAITWPLKASISTVEPSQWSLARQQPCLRKPPPSWPRSAGMVCGNPITEPSVAPAMECATSRGRETKPAHLGRKTRPQPKRGLPRPAVLAPLRGTDDHRPA
jgi:hypothetical protein